MLCQFAHDDSKINVGVWTILVILNFVYVNLNKRHLKTLV
jgi:hypothetical protein